MTARCPECAQVLNLDGGEIGDYFECDECLVALTISSVEPIKVDVLDEEK